MHKKFLFGAASGALALALAFPVLAQVSSAQTVATGIDRENRPPLTDERIQEMIDHDQALLDNVDEMVVVLKDLTDTHRQALSAALTITDETARAAAVRAANDARHEAFKAAMEASPEFKDALPIVPHGPGGRGGHGPARGPGSEKFAEKLGLTVEALKAQIEAGQTIEQIAAEKGIELPARPAGRGPMDRQARGAE